MSIELNDIYNVDCKEKLNQVDEIKEVKYNITNHAQERYVERIMGRDNATDIRVYVNTHREVINERINKLINYGELVFEGSMRDHPVNQFYYKDKWVVIVDPKNNNVVTLYKIDLGDDEVSELFVTKMLDKIKVAQIMLENTKSKAEKEKSELCETVDYNKSQIKYYESMIKSLKETNEGLNVLVNNYNLDIKVKEKEVTDLVETLISRKKF